MNINCFIKEVNYFVEIQGYLQVTGENVIINIKLAINNCLTTKTVRL